LLQNESRYETGGTLYVITTMKGNKGIIGLDFQDYEGLLAFGFKDEEVVLTVKKAKHGSEYSQQVPEHKTRVGLYTIKMEGMPKFQLDLNVRDVEELFARGFKDLEKVALVIEKSPYRVPAEPSKPDELKFEL